MALAWSIKRVLSFNTRARARRAPFSTSSCNDMTRVSTHVPARGGHACRFDEFFLVGGFNTRARARRARASARARSCALPCFNTRARARRAPVQVGAGVVAVQFQHTCPREAGTHSSPLMFASPMFQHTCPREAGTFNCFTAI